MFPQENANQSGGDGKKDGENACGGGGDILEPFHPQPDGDDAGGEGVEDEECPRLPLDGTEVEMEGEVDAKGGGEEKAPQVKVGGDALGADLAGDFLADDNIGCFAKDSANEQELSEQGLPL